MFDFLSFLIFPFLGALKSESYPEKLTPEMEEKYLYQFKHKDMNARNKLILHNLRLVAHIVKKFENTNEEKDDLLSIGIIGLIKAVDTYKFDATNKLATYAARCIENEILMQLRSNKNHNNMYLNSTIGSDKEGNEVILMDVVKDETIDLEKSLISDASSQKLKEALKVLTERELDIIELRYGINNRKIKTQKEIAYEYKISRSYVSRIEKRALMKLYLELLE
ncbi:MAG: RNA polymerase sporulation sigma factor SigK [Erysipelotrichales bacterium]|nr:RNA polymerase sporulation sigma factor SigK [Erysipelotrichales bacterium]